jgi:3-phosphoshikimate 1-carboxyvinyltransferase
MNSSTKFVAPGSVSGEVSAPGSKSTTQRALFAASLCEEEVVISNPSLCDDAIAACGIIEALGAKVEKLGANWKIKPKCGVSSKTLDCNESGLCMRMVPSIASLQDREFSIVGAESLCKRPISMIEAPLRKLGATVSSQAGFPPVKVCGPLKSGSVEIDGSISSQFLSGLLLALPKLARDSEIKAHKLKSIPYVKLTIDLLTQFGVTVTHSDDCSSFYIKGSQSYSCKNYLVEGDWSGASFLLVAAAIRGDVTVKNLNTNSLQADLAILEALRLAGASVNLDKDSVSVRHHNLKGFNFDASECPDLFPPLVALASVAEGETILRGAMRLIHKESNRREALIEEFSKLGIKISADGDLLIIIGNPAGVSSAKVWAHNDHRIAMACAIAALTSKNGVDIDGAECVSKSYPNFFDDLDKIRE